MKIKRGKGKTKYGAGVSIEMDGNEIATAIEAYLVARGVCVRGPRTVSVNNELIRHGRVYVDPSGYAIARGKKITGGPVFECTCPSIGVGGSYMINTNCPVHGDLVKDIHDRFNDYFSHNNSDQS